MGRGRQKAKQQKIARKLKYLTTDTDYDELAKELNTHEPGQGSFDPFESDSYNNSEDYLNESNNEDNSNDLNNVEDSKDANIASDSSNSVSNEDEDLDDYAKWAAQSAAQAATKDKTTSNFASVHHHIPMPMPNFMHKK